MPLSITSHHHLSLTINMYSKEGAGDSGPDRHHTGDYLAPLASVDLSRPRDVAEVTPDSGILTPLQDSEPFNEEPPDRYCLVFLTLVVHRV
ncbi:hypothetical protein O3P69_011681 [Scylla paramamosain]|uniref:Uncharacterized protein n=1 Tax=Scylla paramamosain TaxID=85552 RepID=A0AAW0SDT8_SCYPA